jgi:tyrocidine synthetase III
MRGSTLPEGIEDFYPMSDIEKGMVHYSLKYPDLLLYHTQHFYQIKIDGFDEKLLYKALELMTGKHPMLRTGFNIYDYKEPIQVVHKKTSINLEHHDCADMNKAQREVYINKVGQKNRQNLYDFQDMEPLWKMTSFDLGNSNMGFLWQCHHAIMDGWSSTSLLTELSNTYMELKKNPLFVPGKLESTYKEFIIEQIIEKKNSETIEFWKKELQGYNRIKFPGVEKFNGKTNNIKSHKKKLEGQLLEKLKSAAKKYNSSVKHLCFAAYAYMLGMLSFENDFVVGLLTNNRPLCRDGEKIFGCFLNSMPVRIKIPERITWLDYIGMIEKKMVELKKVDRLPLSEIVGITGEVTPDQNPIFDTLLNFLEFHLFKPGKQGKHNPARTDGDSNELKIDNISDSHFLIDFVIDTTFDTLFISLAYAYPIISDELAAALCRYFEAVLNKFIYDPGSEVNKLELIPEAEKHELLYTFNGVETTTQYPGQKTIHELFSELVARKPNTVAVGDGNRHFSYRVLNEYANRLAKGLRAKGTRREDLIVLMINPSLEMMVGILSILKAGGAYLPIDPAYPTDRIKSLVKESESKTLISHTSFLEQNKQLLHEDGIDTAFFIDNLEELPAQNSDIEIISEPSDLAYVLFTSGTTGKPNGIMGEHRNVCGYIQGLDERFFRTYKKQLIFSMVAPYVFDGSFRVIYGALLLGHTLYIVPEDTRVDGDRLLDFYRKYSIEISDGTPAHVYLMAESQGEDIEIGIKNLLISGDILPLYVVKCFMERFGTRSLEITNAYGPSECCGVSTAYTVTRENMGLTKSLPIGTPLPNKKIYILNKRKELQPIGAVGEVYIGGICVTRGYFKREKLTEEKFTTNPFASGERMYCTGDLACWLPDGNIEFLGRIDFQVKIRGFRIELGEIESQLLKHPGIKETVVIAKEDHVGDKYLCAYIVSDREEIIHELKSWLSNKLPDYMIPTHMVPIKQLPLTPNGKVDRKSLPAPGTPIEDVHILPTNETEEKLTHIWAAVLGIENEKISTNANFFQLGGHSLKAGALTSKVHREFGIITPLVEVFQNPTIKGFAEYVCAAQNSLSP